MSFCLIYTYVRKTFNQQNKDIFFYGYCHIHTPGQAMRRRKSKSGPAMQNLKTKIFILLCAHLCVSLHTNDTQKMKHRLFLALATWLCYTSLQAKDFVWYNGSPITYSLQRHTSTVVETAAHLFEEDMRDVTGQQAQRGDKGILRLYQLDHISDDELQQLHVWHVPYMRIITHPDAFWIGVRNRQIIIVGSNGRGTAYGLMELSRKSGVSPFKEWAGMLPQRHKRLIIDDAQENVEIPSVAYRGLRYPGGDLRKFATLLLRLKGNMIGGVDEDDPINAFGLISEDAQDNITTKKNTHKQKKKKKETYTDLEWSISPLLNRQDDGYGYLTPPVSYENGQQPKSHSREQKETAQNQGLLYHTDGVLPGLVACELHRAWDEQIRSTWMAVSEDPALSALQTSLFMDMAWNINSISTDGAGRYLSQWLQDLFGVSAGEQLIKPMLRYYRLMAQWPKRPWEMTAQEDTPLNADELGNELDRYLNECRDTRNDIDETGQHIGQEQATGFGQLISYPVTLLYEIAEMTLQAQEARHIGRKESFHHDSDALESAARSMLAYEAILHTSTRWPDADPAGRLAKLPVPLLPDTLSRTEINRYGHTTSTKVKINTDGSVVYNAAHYNKAVAATPVPLLGHSAKAMSLQSGGTLEYQFYAREGDVLLRLAFIPVMPSSQEAMQRLTVKIDSGQPQLLSLHEDFSPQRRTQDVIRGQAIRTIELRLTGGNHTLTLAALDPGILIDQWMIDYDRDRMFYLFPIEENTN